MSIISKIQNLISSANAVTGESRTDLTSAVQDLKDGYGQGGAIFEKENYNSLGVINFETGYSVGIPSTQGCICVYENGTAPILNPINNFAIAIRFKFSQVIRNNVLFGMESSSSSAWIPTIYIDSSRKLCTEIYDKNNQYKSITVNYAISENEWYYAVFDKYSSSSQTLYLLADDYSIIASGSVTAEWRANTSLKMKIGNYTTNSGNSPAYVKIDLLKCFVTQNGNELWGKPNENIINIIGTV